MARSLRTFLVSALAVVVGLIVLASWRFNAAPVALDDLARVKSAMRGPEVEALLGRPSRRDAALWTYTTWGSWSIVYVRFDAAGLVTSTTYDR